MRRLDRVVSWSASVSMGGEGVQPWVVGTRHADRERAVPEVDAHGGPRTRVAELQPQMCRGRRDVEPEDHPERRPGPELSLPDACRADGDRRRAPDDAQPHDAPSVVDRTREEVRHGHGDLDLLQAREQRVPVGVRGRDRLDLVDGDDAEARRDGLPERRRSRRRVANEDRDGERAAARAGVSRTRIATASAPPRSCATSTRPTNERRNPADAPRDADRSADCVPPAGNAYRTFILPRLIRPEQLYRPTGRRATRAALPWPAMPR